MYGTPNKHCKMVDIPRGDSWSGAPMGNGGLSSEYGRYCCGLIKSGVGGIATLFPPAPT